MCRFASFHIIEASIVVVYHGVVYKNLLSFVSLHSGIRIDYTVGKKIENQSHAVQSCLPDYGYNVTADYRYSPDFTKFTKAAT